MKDTDHQISEAELTSVIIGLYKKNSPNYDETEKELTIYKDVKSISAIYKLREGNKPTKLHEAGHIFITTNSSLARASRLYEIQSSEEKYFFIPAALTDVFVGTLWIQSPSKIDEINKKRLIASCFAATEPTKAMIKKLTETADRLKVEGTITGEDVVLLKQSRVARNLLQEETLGDPNRFTDKTVIEILDEIRADIQKSAAEKFNQDRNAFKKQETELLNTIEIQRQHTQTVEQKHADTQAELSALESDIDKFVDRVVSIPSGVILVFLIAWVIAVAIFEAVPNAIDNRPILKLFMTCSVILFTVASFCIKGFNAKDGGNRIKRFFKGRIMQVLKGKKQHLN